MRDSQASQQRQLSSFSDLKRIRQRTVHDRDSKLIYMAEVLLGVEDGLCMTTQIGREADAIDDESVWCRSTVRVEAVLVSRNALVGQFPTIEFGEEWYEPFRMLVKDADRFHACAPRIHGAHRLPLW